MAHHPLIVEDGSNVSGSDSYTTVEECEDFTLHYFGENLAGSPDVKNAAIRRATAHLNSYSWKGKRTHGRAQSLAWPRTGVTDTDGNTIADDEIPVEIKEAMHLFARATFSSTDALEPNATFASDRVVAEAVGPLSTQYAAPAKDIDDFVMVVKGAVDRITQFLVTSEGNLTTTFLERA